MNISSCKYVVRAMVLCLVLLPGCRPQTPDPFDIMCRCPYSMQALAWQDTNQDGLRGEEEPLLPGIEVRLEYDTVAVLGAPEPGVTNEKGTAQLEIVLSCPCESKLVIEDYAQNFSLAIVAEAPDTCTLTTPKKLSAAPYQFGFACQPPTPVPTNTPVPTDTPLPTLTPTVTATPTATPESLASVYGNPNVVFTAWDGEDIRVFGANLEEEPVIYYRLSREDNAAYMPVWSPDGKQVAYILYERNTKQSFFRIYDMDTDKTIKPSDQPVDVVGRFCWTYDQKYLIWSQAQPNGMEMDIYRLDLATGKITDLTADSPFWDAFPVCSPVSDQIALVSERADEGDGMDNIWIMDSQGQNLKQLTNTPGWENNFPSWSPDGTTIAYYFWGFSGIFGASDEEFGPPGIYIARLNEGSVRMLVELPNKAPSSGAPVWSPDGQYLAYTINQDESIMLNVISVAGGELVWQSELTGTNDEMSWSANSAYLLFTNTQDKLSRIYVIAIANPHPTPLLPDPDNFLGMFAP